MRGLLRFTMALFLVACVIQMAGAATIDYNLTNPYGDRWQYEYTITNNSEDYLYGFAIYFDNGFYTNLTLEVDPASWDEWDTNFGIWQDSWMVILGDPFAYNDGELLAFNDAGLSPGGILEGLSVSFDWLKPGTSPQYQSFELFGADGVSLGQFGYTSGGDMPPVPEPQSFVLLGTGILGLAAYYRRNRKR